MGNVVHIEIDPDVAAADPVPWALSRLEQVTEHVDHPFRVRVELAEVDSEDPESFRLGRDDSGPFVSAPALRGLAYGITELADRLQLNGGADVVDTSETHSPATPVRGVLRSFSSDVLDLGWFRDPGFWAGYLDELAAQRINRVQLAFGMQYNFSHDVDVVDNYLCFAYPFLLDLPGWNVRATGVDEADRQLNLSALRFASDEARRRGISFRLGLWNHAVRPELGESPRLRYPIVGLHDDQVAEYSAQALKALLEECPSIEGVTFRVHYEGGVPERDHGVFWSHVMAAIREVDRPVEIDMHSKGVDAELLEAARSAGARTSLSPKYWAEHQGLPYHQARVRDLERARPANGDPLAGVTQNTRRFTRYGYGDFLAVDRKQDVIFRVWPGTQRFLLWADPAIFAGYGRWSTIGGALGAELCEPLTFRGRKGTGEGPRDLYADPELHRPADRDWEKYRYAYRLWGRLLYEPDGDPEQWRRYLRREYGAAAAKVEEALSAAGRILPLVTVAFGISASNNFYWPEGYTNLPLFHDEKTGPYDFDTPTPYTWTAASPFDPEAFETTEAFVSGMLAGEASERYTPVDTAAALDGLVKRTEAAVAAAEGEPQTPLLREALVDARILAGLGRMFAERIRAGVDVAIFEHTSEPAQLDRALVALRRSREALAAVVEVAAPVYVDDLAFGDRPTERGSWRERLAQLDSELEEVAERRSTLGTADSARMIDLPAPRSRGAVGVEAVTLTEYDPGTGIPIEVAHLAPFSRARVHYRALDQSATWDVVEARADESGTMHTVIPAAATRSRFPLMWYLTVELGHGPLRYPDLGDDLCGQPYFVLSQAGTEECRTREAPPAQS
ncbi:serine/threonine-protein kinase [Humibacter ginsengisoli]